MVLVATLVGAISAGGLVAAFKTLAPSQSATEVVEIAESKHVRGLRAQLAATCNETKIDRLLRLLAAEGFTEKVPPTIIEYDARCGSKRDRDWLRFSTYKTLRQWANAAALASEFIANDNSDSDYWWWRGETLEAAEKYPQAVADYRQSLANSRGSSGGRFAAGRILQAAPEADAPCTAVFALLYYVEELGGRLGQEDAAILRTHERRNKCKQMSHGKRTSFKRATATDSAVVGATINGVRGRFIVERTSGTTLITDAFAAKAAIVPTGPVVQTLAFGATVDGSAAIATRVELSKLSTDRLEVIVTESFEAGVDGVLGINFLWRFDVKERKNRVELSPRS